MDIFEKFVVGVIIALLLGLIVFFVKHDTSLDNYYETVEQNRRVTN